MAEHDAQSLNQFLMISGFIALVLLIIALKTKSMILSVIIALIFITYGTIANMDANTLRHDWTYPFLDAETRRMIALILYAGYITWAMGAIVLISTAFKKISAGKAPVTSPATGRQFCSQCGASSGSEAQFCNNCGQRLWTDSSISNEVSGP